MESSGWGREKGTWVVATGWSWVGDASTRTPVTDMGGWFGPGYGEGQGANVGVHLEGDGDVAQGWEERPGLVVGLTDIRCEPGPSTRDQTEPPPTPWPGSYLRSPSVLSPPAAHSTAGPRRPAGPAP